MMMMVMVLVQRASLRVTNCGHRAVLFLCIFLPLASAG